jgi:maleate isomerase/arylmalonate decarboxylase
MIDHATYGWRARLGLIVPPTNTANEAEWQRVLPDGITVHATRMPLHAQSDRPIADDDELAVDLRRAAGDVAQAGVAAIAYGCTAGSMTLPLDRLPQIMADATGIPSVTTAGAVVEALRALDVRKIALAAPYHDPMVEHEAAFLRLLGFRITATRGLGIGASGPADFVRLRTVSPSHVYALARATVVPGTDALFLACTDLATLAVVDVLEADLGIPVVTSNQATLWATLRAARVRARIAGWGRLFAVT